MTLTEWSDSNKASPYKKQSIPTPISIIQHYVCMSRNKLRIVFKQWHNKSRLKVNTSDSDV